MALSITKYSEKILNFLELGMNPNVESFLASHTRDNVGGVWSTQRDSKRYIYFGKYLNGNYYIQIIFVMTMIVKIHVKIIFFQYTFSVGERTFFQRS